MLRRKRLTRVERLRGLDRSQHDVDTRPLCVRPHTQATRDVSQSIDFTAADEATLVAAFRAGSARPSRDRDAAPKQIYQLCSVRAQPRRCVRPGAGRVRASVQGPAAVQGRFVADHVAVSDRRERVSESRGGKEAARGANRTSSGGERGRRRRRSVAGGAARERAAAVREAIAKLPPKQRATLVLRIYQECSHEEIAAALGGTVGAAKANLFHALGNLRRALSRNMTNHLRPDEFVDAMDGALAAARGSHLETAPSAAPSCESPGRCGVKRAASTNDLEPSPLFWDHFSARVREAGDAREPARQPWWRTGWQTDCGVDRGCGRCVAIGAT